MDSILEVCVTHSPHHSGNFRFLGISAVGEVDVCDEMMLWNNEK